MDQTNEQKQLSRFLFKKKFQNIIYQRNVFYFKSKLKIQY